MISTNKSKVTILTPYLEVLGPCNGLEEQDGVLLADIAGHIVALPLELKEKLSPQLGQRIALLCTDIVGKEFLIRVLPEKDRTTC